MRSAIKSGKALFSDEKLGTRKSTSCATCHDNAKKPKLKLTSRVTDYPKWDR